MKVMAADLYCPFGNTGFVHEIQRLFLMFVSRYGYVPTIGYADPTAFPQGMKSVTVPITVGLHTVFLSSGNPQASNPSSYVIRIEASSEVPQFQLWLGPVKEETNEAREGDQVLPTDEGINASSTL